jgi:bifunctional non-homologous end joining protein LigD
VSWLIAGTGAVAVRFAGGVPVRRADGTVSPTGRRRSTQPLRVVSQAATKEEALGGLERWRSRWPNASRHVAEEDVLVDGMRGRSSLWYRVRVNLRNVPADERPPDEPPDPDYDPWAAYREGPTSE